jgi:PleD family two-component response regulator
MLGTTQTQPQMVSILCVTSQGDEFQEIRNLLRPISADVAHAFNSEQALVAVRANRIPVVICVESFAGSGWRALLEEMERLPIPPSVIVLRSTPDPKLWADVLTAGGFDVICRPLEFDSLSRAVTAGLRRWQRKRDILSAREENLSALQNNIPYPDYAGNMGLDLETDEAFVFKH